MKELEQGIILSLLTESGWWGSKINKHPLGSELYVIDRLKTKSMILSKAKSACKESLKWLITDGHCSDYAANAVFDSDNTLVITIEMFLKSGETRSFILKREFTYDSNH